jgi:hypothetical protein
VTIEVMGDIRGKIDAQHLTAYDSRGYEQGRRGRRRAGKYGSSPASQVDGEELRARGAEPVSG